MKRLGDVLVAESAPPNGRFAHRGTAVIHRFDTLRYPRRGIWGRVLK